MPTDVAKALADKLLEKAEDKASALIALAEVVAEKSIAKKPPYFSMHELADVAQFDKNAKQNEEIIEKIDENHDVHIRNEGLLKDVVKQTTLTNGRVTKIEEYIINLDKALALQGQTNALLQKMVFGGATMILVAFMSGLIYLIFK